MKKLNGIIKDPPLRSNSQFQLQMDKNIFLNPNQKVSAGDAFVLYHPHQKLYLSYDPMNDETYFVDSVDKLLDWDWHFDNMVIIWCNDLLLHFPEGHRRCNPTQEGFLLKKLTKQELHQLGIQP